MVLLFELVCEYIDMLVKEKDISRVKRGKGFSMDFISKNNPIKYITMGILAHVDAGKTTLAEHLLYLAGSIRKVGRVDHGDTFLDTDAQERARGITIFSKQARLNWGDKEITLLDTPGHTDFSA